jgi:hypothetical protein
VHAQHELWCCLPDWTRHKYAPVTRFRLTGFKAFISVAVYSVILVIEESTHQTRYRVFILASTAFLLPAWLASAALMGYWAWEIWTRSQGPNESWLRMEGIACLTCAGSELFPL